MKTNACFPRWLAALLLSGAALSLAADTHNPVNTPGFRPDSELAGRFLHHVSSNRIAVLPTVVRTRTTTMTFEAPQKVIVQFLTEHKLGIPQERKLKLDVGELKGQSQFQWFQNDQMRLGGVVKTQSGADYYMILEYLMPKAPSGSIAVFGIHIYVLDGEGNNVFSFLLNSHHKILVDAGLKSADSSEQGYEALALKATPVALDALSEQIKQARNAEFH